MRFQRFGRHPFKDTPMKRAAVLRRQKAEIQRMPLFADQVAAEHQTVDDEMAERAEMAARRQAERRQQHAAGWRKARAALRSYPEDIRSKLLKHWNSCGWPAAPEYMFCMFKMFDEGRLTMKGCS